ncbi:uncharacterized protein At4g26485-like [Silene latifolia]|uniref:uncharacterized protein At4g26485-like n=1 Tax=Silene latifolia TaxID=37657 RepID=UPI003D77B378
MGRIDDILSRMVGMIRLADEKIEIEKRIPYKSSQKILLVGEGDFSFATCLANVFGNASNLFATSLDSYSEVIERLHRDLVRGFLKNAYELVSYKGQIHITHKTAYPFDRWNIRELAKEARMEYVVETEFNKWDYPGYCNKRGEGHGIRCDESFPVGACSTFVISIVTLV